MSNFDHNQAYPLQIEITKTSIPKIFIDEHALSKMQVIVEECEEEVGWLGSVVPYEDGYLVEDVHLFAQRVSATTTEISPEGLEEFATTLLSQPNGVERWNNIRLWGHSHVKMAPLPSGQDNMQMEEFSKMGHPWFLRLICNKLGAMKLDFYDYQRQVVINAIPWEPRVSDAVVLEAEERIAQLAMFIQARKQELRETLRTPLKTEIAAKVKRLSYFAADYKSPHPYGTLGYLRREHEVDVELEAEAYGMPDWKGATSRSSLLVEDEDEDLFSAKGIVYSLKVHELETLMSLRLPRDIKRYLSKVGYSFKHLDAHEISKLPHLCALRLNALSIGGGRS